MTVRRSARPVRWLAPLVLLISLPACTAWGGRGPSPFPFVGDDEPWTVESEHRDESPRRMGERFPTADAPLPRGPATPGVAGAATGSPDGYEPAAIPELYEPPSEAVLLLWEELAGVARAVYRARELANLGHLGDACLPCGETDSYR